MNSDLLGAINHPLMPNFCYSECAGSVSVPIGSKRRHIAERQR